MSKWGGERDHARPFVASLSSPQALTKRKPPSPKKRKNVETEELPGTRKSNDVLRRDRTPRDTEPSQACCRRSSFFFDFVYRFRCFPPVSFFHGAIIAMQFFSRMPLIPPQILTHYTFSRRNVSSIFCVLDDPLPLKACCLPSAPCTALPT